jgi:hypothetical protein
MTCSNHSSLPTLISVKISGDVQILYI